jgi:hypothetical protein
MGRTKQTMMLLRSVAAVVVELLGDSTPTQPASYSLALAQLINKKQPAPTFRIQSLDVLPPTKSMTRSCYFYSRSFTPHRRD